MKTVIPSFGLLLGSFLFFSSLVNGELISQETQSQNTKSPTSGDAPKELKTLKEKASYLVGYDIGEDILRRELDVDPEILIRGLLDAIKRKDPPLSKTEMESVMNAFEKQVAEKANARWKELARSNLEKGSAFLARNKLAEGVIQLESGLQYRVIQSAKGDKPKNGDRVKVHVHGKHIDGSTFENTYETKTPVTVTVGATLRGLDEALRRMAIGEKWELFIPADQAFGQRGSPPLVGPNETLIYEVELLEITGTK